MPRVPRLLRTRNADAWRPLGYLGQIRLLWLVPRSVRVFDHAWNMRGERSTFQLFRTASRRLRSQIDLGYRLKGPWAGGNGLGRWAVDLRSGATSRVERWCGPGRAGSTRIGLVSLSGDHWERLNLTRFGEGRGKRPSRLVSARLGCRRKLPFFISSALSAGNIEFLWVSPLGISFEKE